jgi:hypothetical protein
MFKMMVRFTTQKVSFLSNSSIKKGIVGHNSVILASQPASQSFSKKLLIGMLSNLRVELLLDTDLTIS